MTTAAPRWNTCSHCGEQRDTSNRYTSPANAERDRRRWAQTHGTGACTNPSQTPHP